MMPTRHFERVYYAMAGVTFAAIACLPWLVPLSYRALGLDPRLARSGTHEAFRAHLATTSLRGDFLRALLLLALGLFAMSLAALLQRALRRTDLPWPVLLVTLGVAAGVAVVTVAGLTVGTCC